MPNTAEHPSVEAVTAAPPAQGTAPRGEVWAIGLALAVGAAGLGASVMLWLRFDQTQQELVRRSADTQTQVASAQVVAGQAESLAQQLQARLGVVEVRLSEVSLQRSQLEELMLSVSRSRDDSLVQDLESALQLAQQQSHLTGSVQPLISALQAADRRIARAAQPRLNPIQRAIGRDIERIQAASLLDVPALAMRLDELVRSIDELPLANAVASQRKPTEAVSAPGKAVQATANKAAATSPAVTGAAGMWNQVTQWWSSASNRWWSQLREGTNELVRVSRIDRPEAALMAPDQAVFLRENLKLTLLNARLGLLARQIDTARSDVQTAQLLVSRYFDERKPATQTAQQSLAQLHKDLRQVATPRPDDTLAALTTASEGR
jgi:uroporphyrin-III C-methyltransferase